VDKINQSINAYQNQAKLINKNYIKSYFFQRKSKTNLKAKNVQAQYFEIVFI